MNFQCKNKNKRNNLQCDFDLNKCYPGHDSEQLLIQAF